MQPSTNVVHDFRIVEHADFDPAMPTPGHFIPLLNVAAVAGATPDVLVDGNTDGSLSMTCYTI